jgi:hypothetical protein
LKLLYIDPLPYRVKDRLLTNMQYESMSLQAAQNEAKRLVETLSYLNKYGGNYNKDSNYKDNKDNKDDKEKNWKNGKNNHTKYNIT